MRWTAEQLAWPRRAISSAEQRRRCNHNPGDEYGHAGEQHNVIDKLGCSRDVRFQYPVYPKADAFVQREPLPSVTSGSRLAASDECAAWQGANRVSTDCGDGGGQSWAGTKDQKAQTVRADATTKAAVPRTKSREGMAVS